MVADSEIAVYTTKLMAGTDAALFLSYLIAKRGSSDYCIAHEGRLLGSNSASFPEAVFWPVTATCPIEG
jgi:hypothetical protein